MSARCDAIEGNFAWFSQQCINEAVGTVEQDGETFNVCVDHGGRP